jgi:signal recognition particle receptor subunit beta
LPETESDAVSLATMTDRTLFFDYLRLDLGKRQMMGGEFDIKIQLYTVPGKEHFSATRKLVLRGLDGVIFVADCNPLRIGENVASYSNLCENLAECGYALEEIPIVFQFNKSDLYGGTDVERTRARFPSDSTNSVTSIAIRRIGVFESLQLVTDAVIKRLARNYSSRPSGSPRLHPDSVSIPLPERLSG